MTSKILYIQYTSPACYPSLEHSSRILADKNWKILFCGIDISGVETLQFLPRPNIIVRKLSSCPTGWRQKLHYLWFCIWVIGWVIAWRPCWIYASDPLSCPAGLLLSYIPGLKVIYHEHDSPTSISNATCFMRFVLWERSKLSRRAKLCILPNEQRAKYFAKEIGNLKNTLIVQNCPAKDEACSIRPEYIGNSLWVIYHGSVVPSRLPSTTLNALVRLSERVKLMIIGYETVGHAGYMEHLLKSALRLGISHRVKFVGVVPTRKELFEFCKKGDIGITFMPMQSYDINEQTMAGASNKPFEYLACGLALLVSDLPDWRKMYVEPGYGLACNPDDPESILAGLKWFLEHPREMRQMGERGRQKILQEWNYEIQFKQVIDHAATIYKKDIK